MREDLGEKTVMCKMYCACSIKRLRWPYYNLWIVIHNVPFRPAGFFFKSIEKDILHLVTNVSLCWCVVEVFYLLLNLESMAVLFYTSLLLSQTATTQPPPPPPSSSYCKRIAEPEKYTLHTCLLSTNNNIEDLHRAVEDAFHTVTPKMLRHMSQRTWRRIRLCVRHQGAHTDSLDM